MMKSKIKIIVIILSIILGTAIIWCVISFSVDNSRVRKGQTPMFCIKNPRGNINDGGTIEYFGLGYKIIDFNTL